MTHSFVTWLLGVMVLLTVQPKVPTIPFDGYDPSPPTVSLLPMASTMGVNHD